MRLTALFILLSNLMIGQGLEYIDIQVQSINNKILLTWKVNAGASCQNLELQHSTDGMSFQTYYVYSGVCGDPEIETVYQHTHSSPISGKSNFYRIKINQEYTTIRQLFLSKRKVTILPHPLVEQSEILISERNDLVKLFVYANSGQMVISKQFETGQPIVVSRNELKAGNYLVHIVTGTISEITHLIVQ